MKKMFKQTAAYVLAGALSLSLLAGCAPPEVPGDGGKETGTAGGSGAGQTEAGQTGTSGDEVVLTAVIKDMSAGDEVSERFLMTLGETVSEQVGQPVKIKLAPISEGTYSESMGLLLQSGEIPDLMYFQGGDYQFAITQEILEDLTPYIDGSTYVKEMMQPFNQERIKNYPYLLWLAPDRVKVPVVRQDWFDEMESGAALLADPTLENYKDFFAEMKEKKGLQAAITVPGDLAELDTIFNLAFGIDRSWLKQDGAYVYSKVSNAEKEKLAFYAELYQSGLLDNEWLSKKWDTKESAFYDGDVGVVAGTAGGVANVYNNKMTSQNGASAKLLVLPPAKGAAQGFTPSDVSKESRGWAISTYSEHKDIAFAVLEYMASPEGQIFDKFGYEGEHHTMDNGVYTLTDKITEWYPRIHESLLTFDAKTAEDTPYFSAPAVASLEAIREYASLDNKFIMPEDDVTNWDAGEALYAEYASDIISGKKPVDSFDEFVKEWNALGGAKITEYANEIIK